MKKEIKKYLDKIKIYWKEEESKQVSLIIEKMLDFVLKPRFNSFKVKLILRNSKKIYESI